jgi:hypothetical protein
MACDTLPTAIPESEDQALKIDRGHLALLAVAIVIGIAIGVVDTSPGWDSTGISAVSLALSAAAVAAVGRSHPWLWALAVGLPFVVLEIAATNDPTMIVVLGFTAAGAAFGWAIRRSLTPDVPRAG